MQAIKNLSSLGTHAILNKLSCSETLFRLYDSTILYRFHLILAAYWFKWHYQKTAKDQSNMKFENLQISPVKLEPLHMSHCSDLYYYGSNKNIWTHLPQKPLLSKADTAEYITLALAEKTMGNYIPFAIIDGVNKRAVGYTSFKSINTNTKVVEVAQTWLGVEYQRTAFNSLCKYLMLSTAFDTNKFRRVEFKTDSRNLISQKSLERLGARQEGVIRNHTVFPDGNTKDTIIYSILDTEWDEVKQSLQSLINSYDLASAECNTLDL